jgi:hypothetical protein
MLRSIAVAIGLTLGLGVIFAVTILLVNRTGNSGGGTSGNATPTPCQFTSSGAILTVYQAPVTDATQALARLPGSESYPVSKTRGEYVLITLHDGRTAWADKRTGTLQGGCRNVPVDDMPLTSFPGLCTFTNTTDVPLFRDSGLTGAIGSVVPGVYPLIGINQTHYYLYQDTNQGGWVLGSMGFVQGNCAMLPARPG